MNKESMKTNQVKMSFFSFAIAFMLHLLLFATAPLATIMMKEMNLSHAGFAFIFGVAMISLIIFRIPWGGYRRPDWFSTCLSDCSTSLGYCRGYSCFFA